MMKKYWKTKLCSVVNNDVVNIIAVEWAKTTGKLSENMIRSTLGTVWISLERYYGSFSYYSHVFRPFLTIFQKRCTNKTAAAPLMIQEMKRSVCWIFPIKTVKFYLFDGCVFFIKIQASRLAYVRRCKSLSGLE